MKRLGSRVDPGEYEALALRAHSLLAGVPLHDVWRLALPGGGAGRSIEDVRALMSVERVAELNPAVRALFGLRRLLGRIFGWDANTPDSAARREMPSLVGALDEAERRESLVAAGTSDGPFRVVYVHRYEGLNEIRNATVHAFSVLALKPTEAGYDLYWAIYVKPVGRITAFYMALIDPFRRFIVYPAMLRHVHRSWCDAYPR